MAPCRTPRTLLPSGPHTSFSRGQTRPSGTGLVRAGADETSLSTPADQVSIPAMQTLERLTAGDLVAVVKAYRDALRAHQEAINRLNVYPVPDGDTGTNMALTLESVVREMAGRDGDDMSAVAEAISYGSLMGA